VHTLQTFTNSNSAQQISAAMTPVTKAVRLHNFWDVKEVRGNVPLWYVEKVCDTLSFSSTIWIWLQNFWFSISG